MGEELRVMSIMAHQDDFEFNAGGVFALMRKTAGSNVRLKILATTRGASGHHEMDADATFRRRDQEARHSASLIDAEYECLRQLDGSHPTGQVFLDRNFMGGLWNAIRAFEPHCIFCPPVISDPLAGVHIDHLNTAHAVRLIAYQLIVPHAYPTMDGPVKQRVASPVIVNVDDSYAAETGWHVAVDIADVWQTKVTMALCHTSQVLEWLPWTRNQPAPTEHEWLETFKQRHTEYNVRYGQPNDARREYFRVTHWGRSPSREEIARFFPNGQISEAGKAFLKFKD